MVRTQSRLNDRSRISVGAMVRTQSPSVSSVGDASHIFSNGQPAGLAGLGGLDEVTAPENNRSFQA
jgi:hypothetical protein